MVQGEEGRQKRTGYAQKRTGYAEQDRQNRTDRI
jgi:hypothetical protein